MTLIFFVFIKIIKTLLLMIFSTNNSFYSYNYLQILHHALVFSSISSFPFVIIEIKIKPFFYEI